MVRSSCSPVGSLSVELSVDLEEYVVIEWPRIAFDFHTYSIDSQNCVCHGTVNSPEPVLDGVWSPRFNEDYSPDEHSVTFADKPKPQGRSLLKPRSAITDILECDVEGAGNPIR